jgi:elongation factor G
MAQKDPTFAVSVDPESGETILKGMGDLHLDIKLDRLQRVYGVGFNPGPLVISYREKFARATEAEATFERSINGTSHFARVKLRMEPEDLAMANTFVSEVDSDPLWDDYVRGVEVGVREFWKQGILLGFPMVDMKVTLLEVDYLEGESSAMAFQAAARQAMKEGCEAAGVKLLEPVMAVEVAMPGDCIGWVIADLKDRGGQIFDMMMVESDTVVGAYVPMSRLFGYGSEVARISAGRARHKMEFNCYAEVPRNVLPDDDPENFPPAIGMRA